MNGTVDPIQYHRALARLFARILVFSWAVTCFSKCGLFGKGAASLRASGQKSRATAALRGDSTRCHSDGSGHKAVKTLFAVRSCGFTPRSVMESPAAS